MPGFRLSFLPLSLLLCLIHLVACTHRQDTGHQLPTDSQYHWTKTAEAGPWGKSYNFQMVVIRDTLWVLHAEGNWYSTDGSSWTKSSLSNAIGNLTFLDYVVFHDTLFGLGHFEGNEEQHQMRPTIYYSSNHTSWDSIEHTNLPQRYFYHPFVFDDKIWIIGGEDESNIYSDIIQSTDGIHWQIMKDKLPFGPINNSQFVIFKDKIRMFNNDVWSSTDGLNWVQDTKQIISGETIFGYAALVFDHRMWLIGCNRNGQINSQVLLSQDGIHWTEETASWTARGGVAACAFGNKVIMTGGKYGGTPQWSEFVYSHDIWVMEKNTAGH